MQKANDLYVQTKFTTVGQGELLLLLYDGALKFLAQAKEKMLAKDYAAKGQLISKALDVINELDGSLNREVGGELAQNLHQLYFLCSSRLLQANLRMEPHLIDSVCEILSGLRSAYAQIVNRPEAQAAAQQIAARNARSASAPRAAAAVPPPPVFSTGMTLSMARSAYTQQNTVLPADGPAASETRESALPQANAPAVEEAAVSPQAPLPPLSLGGRRMAASAIYGKMAGM